MGQIKVEKNVGGIEGLCVIEPAVHGDARGYFMETYNEKDMKEAGIDIHFVQDNQSMSTKGVLRGLHFQKQYPQCKLVRAVRGTVFDVAVDLRSNSETYGKWYGVTLSAENKKQFLIPEGFAHGFLVLSDEAEFCYKVNDFWHPNDEGGMHDWWMALAASCFGRIEFISEPTILYRQHGNNVVGATNVNSLSFIIKRLTGSAHVKETLSRD